MALPTNFQFSQGSLQDFADCPRRFQLKYIQRLAWPAVQAEPALENERYMQLGATFHRMVQQFLLGVPAERLAEMAAGDEMLSQWWGNYAQHGPALSGCAQRPEITLSAPMGDYRLVAKYDLVVWPSPPAPSPQPSPKGRGSLDSPLPVGQGLGGSGVRGKITIYDWKTSRKQTRREWLAEKLQTRVYPYLLVRAGAHFITPEGGNEGKSIEPEQIEMVYWFANFPNLPERFAYSTEQFAADEEYITGLIDAIQAIGEEDAPLTDEEWRCKYCLYRSLCNRGVKAGPLDEMEDFDARDEFEFELDFEQIAEVEY
ncbi:MAG: PD-(D/E)XK nuclease family protein [Chloroflexi bacterium]|nr:PD-(D/E)XK nuclease family protein [Chloroflexota bacterium]MBU1660969.1 PD-(D/E)XK nuclease family protein [Chloroflexota bacterium]